MSGWRVCGFGVVLASFRIAFLRSGLGTRLWIVTNGSRDSIKSWAQMGHNEFHVTCSTRPNIVRNGALRPGNLIVAAPRQSVQPGVMVMATATKRIYGYLS